MAGLENRLCCLLTPHYLLLNMRTFISFSQKKYAEGSQVGTVKLFTSKPEEIIKPINVIEDSVEVNDAETVEIKEPVQEDAKEIKKSLVPIVFVGKAIKKSR